MLNEKARNKKAENIIPEPREDGDSKNGIGTSPPPNAGTPGPHNPRNGFNWHYALVILAIMGFNLFLLTSHKQPEMIDYSAFKEKIQSGSIKRVEIEKEILFGFPNRLEEMKKMDPQKRSKAELDAFKTVMLDEAGLIRLMDSVKVEYIARPITGKILSNIMFNWIIPGLVFFAIFRFMSGKMGGMGQGLMSFGKSRANVVSVKDMGVTFADVAGVDEAKEELMEVIDFLKQPEKYTAVGGKSQKGSYW